MIGFRKYWYGKECEGRLTDVETLFIADTSVSEQDLDMKQCPHIYFCSTAVNQLINDEGELTWEWLNDFIDETNITVSLEVTPGMLRQLPAMIVIKTHIMYMIHDKEVGLLKKNDSIKVVYGDYKLYCNSIQNMQKVTPDDYKYDRYE
tara:strand:- start:79 stop:522 length:444 start_codon:yes stop_codon:yes gene_type:complete